MSLEPQRPAIFRDGADNVVGRAVGEFHMDFEGDLDVRSHEASQVLDDFFSDPARVASDPSRIERNGAEKALWTCRHRLDTDGGAIGGMVHTGMPSRRWIRLTGHSGACRLCPGLILG